VSIKVMTRIWSHSHACGAELLVMLALGDFSNDQGESYPSLRILAEKSRLTVRGVCKILDRLEGIGEIRRQRCRGGKNRRTRYFITLSNSGYGSVNGIQRTAYSVYRDTQTVNGCSDAINRQGTINIGTGADSAKEKRGRTRSDRRIPDEVRPITERVLGRLNELAGTNYRVDSQIVLNGLVPRLQGGATESDCIVVVEDRWREWREKPEMRQYFNPETLFRESKFEKYLNAARMARANGNGHPNSGGRNVEGFAP
jgi:uncharacterized phage protein (TIGR02220 family)